MHRWRNYVSSTGPRPGPIDNSEVKELIEKKRVQMGYPDNENDFMLNDKEDYYILSAGFFKYYYDIYDCKNIMIIKYTMKNETKEINGDFLNASAYPIKIMRN